MANEIINYVKSQNLQELNSLIEYYKNNNCISKNNILSFYFQKFCGNTRKFLTINFKRISIAITKNQYTYSIIIRFERGNFNNIKLLKYIDYDSNLPLFFELFELLSDDNDAEKYINSIHFIDTINNLMKYRLNKPYMHNTTCILISACILLESG